MKAIDPRTSAKLVQKTGLDIGFLCAGWPPDVGGVESHAQDLARALVARGHRVHVLCLDVSADGEPFSTHTKDVDGIEVRRMVYAYGDHDRLARVVVNLRAEEVIQCWLADTPCDVVHVHHLTGFGMGALRAISASGAPCLMTLHDYWPLCPRGQMLSAAKSICERPETEACTNCLNSTWPHLMPSGAGVASGPRDEPLSDDGEAVDARTAFALEMLELPDRLFTPSEAARAVYLKAGLNPDRVAVCENGVDVDDLAAQVSSARAKAGSDDDASVRLGILGTVLPSKGVLELARVFVEAQVPGLKLEVHGNLPSYHGDESYVQELNALGASHPDLTIHGPYAREELVGILGGLDGVAAPSRWEEVFGLSVREARAAGLSVLVSNAGALPDVLRNPNSDTAASGQWIVDRDDWNAWAKVLHEFAGNPELRSAGSQGANAPRTSKSMMLQLERAYVEVIVDSTDAMPHLLHSIEGLESKPEPEPRQSGWLGRIFNGFGSR
ncbi:MAG: glycosyltransferase involved in cell wall biosynthesis [Planctomycetota bacterium]|jgi:glycosyltransferase involved in cell wall biosynthesis